MANVTKQASTRFSIVKRSKGQSAVEKASYISRSILVSEFDGQTYRPKYHEDLVHSEITLPPNAPKEYADRATLWNAVELSEKGQKSQLARMLKASLPNEWSYELAEEVVRDYVQRNFVDKGMCADWAIHDSENDKGQRNLHIHVLLTMRPLTENGEWGAKTKKVYVLDENGERVPLIDKKTGQQKVDNRNRKQWKCQTVESTDWNSQENAKMWRKDLADTINATNEQLGIDVHWEHRSFKEQGIDKEPTIHIGATANALERKGIQTERGNINREIVKRNMMLEQAKAMLELAKQEVQSIQYAKIRNAAVSMKNDVMEMIAKVRERKGRLDLPIVSGKHLRKISDRTALQSADNAEKFIATKKIDSFESLAKFTADTEQKYGQLDSVHLSKGQKLSRLKELSKMYALYEPYRTTYKESQSLKRLAKMKFDREHKESLAKYPEMRERLQNLLEQGEKITPKQWKAEIQSLQAEYDSIGREKSKTATELAYALGHMDGSAELYESLRCILAPLVAVQDQASLCQMLGIQRLLQGAHGQVAGDVPVRYAGHHAPVIEVYDGAVVPDVPVLQEQVCEIRAPFLVRLVRMEVLPQLVLEYFMGLPGLCPRFFRADDGMQAHLRVHIFMDGSGAVAIPFALQVGCHASVAIDAVVPVVDLIYLPLDFCFLGAIIRLPVFPVVIIGIRADPQPP